MNIKFKKYHALGNNIYYLHLGVGHVVIFVEDIYSFDTKIIGKGS